MNEIKNDIKKDQKGDKKGHGQDPRISIKTRSPISEMREPIIRFCEEQKEMYIALNNDSDFPLLEVADYRYISGEHIIILTPISTFLDKFENNSKFTGFIFDKKGHGLKMTRRIYGNFICQELNVNSEILKPLAEIDPMVKKMLTHGAKFFSLKSENLTAYFGGGEIFTLDNDMNPSFAKFAPNGKERFENCRHVLMEYEGKEVIFNVIIEDDIYYTLTKSNSNKMSYITNDGECKFYDGRDNHFTSKIKVLDNSTTNDIFNKLVKSNHAYFKNMDNLVGLSFSK